MGVAHNVGDALTYKILTDDTKKIIYHSAVRPRDDKDPNNCLDIFGGIEADKPIKSVIKSKEYALPDVHTITFSLDDLVGRTFLKQPEEKMGSVSELELSVRSYRWTKTRKRYSSL